MSGPVLPLLAALGLAAAPALADTLWIANTDRCRAWRHELPGEGRFRITYHHSIYDRPVTEEYAAADGRLTLRGLESTSAAVLEYFGVTAPGTRHARDQALPRLALRIAMGEPQRLAWDGEAHSLREYGEPGDRLELRASEAPATPCGR